MKKIKFLMIALLAICGAMSFTACSDDDDDDKAVNNNYTVYQNAVNQTVKSQKKNSKAILLVAFGSTWQQAYDAFDSTVDAYKAAFPGYEREAPQFLRTPVLAHRFRTGWREILRNRGAVAASHPR